MGNEAEMSRGGGGGYKISIAAMCVVLVYTGIESKPFGSTGAQL